MPIQVDTASSARAAAGSADPGWAGPAAGRRRAAAASRRRRRDDGGCRRSSESFGQARPAIVVFLAIVAFVYLLAMLDPVRHALGADPAGGDRLSAMIGIAAGRRATGVVDRYRLLPAQDAQPLLASRPVRGDVSRRPPVRRRAGGGDHCSEFSSWSTTPTRALPPTLQFPSNRTGRPQARKLLDPIVPRDRRFRSVRRAGLLLGLRSRIRIARKREATLAAMTPGPSPRRPTRSPRARRSRSARPRPSRPARRTGTRPSRRSRERSGRAASRSWPTAVRLLGNWNG